MAKNEKNARFDIAGRRLFQDNFDESPVNIASKMKQPVSLLSFFSHIF
jgi:hypothetical protein